MNKDFKKACWEMLKKKNDDFKDFKTYEDWLIRDGKRKEEPRERTTEQLKVDYNIKIEPEKGFKKVKIKLSDGEVTLRAGEENLSKEDKKTIAEFERIKKSSKGRKTKIKN